MLRIGFSEGLVFGLLARGLVGTPTIVQAVRGMKCNLICGDLDEAHWVYKLDK